MWFRASSPLLLVAAAAIWFAQQVPMIGIFLMFMGAPFWPGLLLHIFLIGTLYDSLTGRLPRSLALIPVMAYGAYYGLYVQDWMTVRARDQALAATNPGLVLRFDAAHQDLVSENAGALVSRYVIPHAYSRYDTAEGYRVHFLLPRGQCDIKQDGQARLFVSYWAFHGDVQSDPCNLSFPHAPEKPVVEVTRASAGKPGERTEVAILTVDGVQKARFTTVETQRLSAIPFLIAGCGLNDAESRWQCFFQFSHATVHLTGGAETGETAPEEMMLGLKPYDDAAHASFHGFDANAALVALAHKLTGQTDDKTYQNLEAALDDEDTLLTLPGEYAASRIGDRLSPLAGRMADRFVALAGDTSNNVMACAHQARPDHNLTEQDVTGRAGWRKNMEDTSGEHVFWDCWKQLPNHPKRAALQETLAGGLAALPNADFAPLAPRLYAALQRPGVNGDYLPWLYPALYIRSSGTAPSAQLKQDYFYNRQARFYLNTAPVLGLCRAGQADAQTIADLKNNFTATDDDRMRQAILLVMLKIGDKAWVAANKATLRFPNWAQVLLEGRGWNAIGPNNCMLQEDLGGGLVPPVMKPLLEREGRGESWVVVR